MLVVPPAVDIALKSAALSRHVVIPSAFSVIDSFLNLIPSYTFFNSSIGNTDAKIVSPELSVEPLPQVALPSSDQTGLVASLAENLLVPCDSLESG